MSREFVKDYRSYKGDAPPICRYGRAAVLLRRHSPYNSHNPHFPKEKHEYPLQSRGKALTLLRITYANLIMTYLPAMIRHLIIILSALASLSAFGADKYLFRRLELSDGLSSNNINCVYRDAKGFVWIGTTSGLNRYDGYSIRAYRSHRGETTSLNDNMVQEIHGDADGHLWVMGGGNYGVYLPERDCFDNDMEKRMAAFGLEQWISRMAIHGKGYWFYCQGKGLHYAEAGHRSSRSFTGGGLEKQEVCVTAICPLPDGRRAMLATDDGRLLAADNTTGHVRKVDAIFTGGSRNLTPSLFLDSDGILWVYGAFGLYTFDTATMHRRPCALDAQSAARSIKAVQQDPTGRVWIGYDHGGIDILDKGGAKTHVATDPLDQHSLANNSIASLYCDPTGTMWVGTYKKGLSVWNESMFKIDIVPIEDVTCASQAADGTVWLGTDASGLVHWDPVSGKTDYIHDPADGTDNAPVVCLLPEGQGVWVGTYGKGLKYYSGGTFKHYTTRDGLAREDIWSVKRDRLGNLWIGTLGGGVQRMDAHTGELKTFDAHNSPLAHNFISNINLAPNGMLWVSTAVGLSSINPQTGAITTIREMCDGSKLSNLNLIDAYADSRGLIWIATREGLDVYDPAAHHIYNVELGQGLDRPYVLGLVEDEMHAMWIALDGNMAQVGVGQDINKGGYDFTVHIYSRHDGIQQGAFNQRSLCALRGGDIIAGGVYGLNRVKPNKIRYNMYRPRVVFTDLYIGDRRTDCGQEGSPLEETDLPYLNAIRLDHSQREFTVYFSTDNLVLPRHTTFMYRLRGQSDEWTKCPEGMHQVSYSNLPSGTYTLEVKAINSDGVESEKAATLEIKVLPPWWATWWAWLLYIALIASGAWLTFRRVKRHEQELYDRRTKDNAAAKQEELNQLKFRFFTNVSHELRTPLSLIISPVEAMLKEPHTEQTIRRLTMVRENAQRLLYLVNEILDFRKAEAAKLQLNTAYGDFSALVRQVCQMFRDTADRRLIHFNTDGIEDALTAGFDADKMQKVVTNLLSNAMKFTADGGNVSVALTKNGPRLRLTVTDDGVGVPDADKERIFERFYQTREGTRQGTGIGLSLVAEFVQMHGGTIHVEDNPTGGAVFIVEIPAEQASDKADDKADDAEAVEITAQVEEDGAVDNSLPIVLIVDDNSDMIDFLTSELKDTYRVAAARNGQEALEKIAREKPAVVVSDVMMPVMDGIELCRRIKSDQKLLDLPVMMLSAKGDAQSVVEGLTIGADDYVTKPFNNDVLMAKIARLVQLRGKGLRRTLIEPEPSQIEITSLDQQLIEKAVQYVEKHIDNPELTVEMMATDLGMSRVHLYKRLQTLTGKSPQEFIRVIRLKRAAQYLRESQRGVYEIGYLVGFNTPKVFTRHFKEEFGMTPTEYRGTAEASEE